ncbi:MAG: hypothetical protein IPF71_02390 [Rhodoferax sp.]|nr:hypothetical protein [Rhodoferax sp.]
MSKRQSAPPVSARQRKSGTAIASAKPKPRKRQAASRAQAVEGEDSPEEKEVIEGVDERLADSTETLPELEREVGIADWIDPETGEPAEGQCPPHLEAEYWP